VTAALRRLGALLIHFADRLEQRALRETSEEWHDGRAQRRVFELRTRIHSGYY
jgi:hypothetical protein